MADAGARSVRDDFTGASISCRICARPFEVEAEQHVQVEKGGVGWIGMEPV